MDLSPDSSPSPDASTTSLTSNEHSSALPMRRRGDHSEMD